MRQESDLIMEDSADIPGELSISKSGYEQTIEGIVETLIAERGYDSVIYELVSHVYKLSETCIDDPANSANRREFRAWAMAVRSAIVQWDGDRAFENSVTNPDRWFAQQLGITLD